MIPTSKLQIIKDRLDKCGSKADFDKLSDDLAKWIHEEQIAHNPKLGEQERKAQARKEAQILVAKMKANVDSIKAEHKPGGRFENMQSQHYQQGLERAESNLSAAETAGTSVLMHSSHNLRSRLPLESARGSPGGLRSDLKAE